MSVLKQTVIDLVKAFVEEREPFTSLDLSNEVKTLLPEVRHREVAEVLRGIWREDSLRPSGEGARWFCTGGQRAERTRIEVGHVGSERKGAWLYHPLDTDPGEVYPEARRHAQAIPPLDRPTDFVCNAVRITMRSEAFVAPVSDQVTKTYADTGSEFKFACGLSVAKDDVRPCVLPKGHAGFCAGQCQHGFIDSQCARSEGHDGPHTNHSCPGYGCLLSLGHAGSCVTSSI